MHFALSKICLKNFTSRNCHQTGLAAELLLASDAYRHGNHSFFGACQFKKKSGPCQLVDNFQQHYDQTYASFLRYRHRSVVTVSVPIGLFQNTSRIIFISKSILDCFGFRGNKKKREELD